MYRRVLALHAKGNAGLVDISAYSEDVLAARVRKKKPSTTRTTGLQQKETQLTRDIEAWMPIAHLYIPISATLQAQMNTSCDPSSKATPSFKMKLWLPSSVPSTYRTSGWALHNLHGKEAILRLAQMEDAIVELRDVLRTEQGMRIQFNKDVKNTGQRRVTRALSTLKSIQFRITRIVQRYCTARQALISLDPDGPWSLYYLKLEDKDVRGQSWEEDANDIERREMRDARRELYLKRQRRGGEASQGRFEPSWIWSAQIGNARLTKHSSDCRSFDPNDKSSTGVVS